MKSILEFPITIGYLSHWNMWHAVRELLQNGIDARDMTPDSKPIVELTENKFNITTNGVIIPRTALLLGMSTKRESSDAVGQFGEGFKLAALVACRYRCKFSVRTGTEHWHAFIGYSTTFKDTQVLKFSIVDGLENVNSTTFTVTGPGVAAVQLGIDLWYIPNMYTDTILDDPKYKCLVYVNGLYIDSNKDLQYGYSFTPGRLRLDRDRQTVASFDVEYEASRMIAEQRPEEILQLSIDGRRETAFSNSFMCNTGASKVYSSYITKYGNAVPVVTQEDINKLPAGVKFQLVPACIKTILSKIVSWVYSPTMSLESRLQRWIGKYGSVLPDDGKKELETLISEVKNLERR